MADDCREDLAIQVTAAALDALPGIARPAASIETALTPVVAAGYPNDRPTGRLK
jgi:hypothetical protein